MARLLLTSPRLAIAIAKLGGGAFGPAERAFRRGDDTAAIEYLGRGILGDRGFDALSAERCRQVWDNRGPDRAQALYRGFPDLTGDAISTVAQPILLIAGADSPPVFGLLTDSLLKRLRNGRKCVVSNASHMVHEDAPEALNSAILEFLGTVG